jgi:HEAT repeat protein
VVLVVVATLLYREYGANLLAGLRGRTLDPASLTVDDESTIIVIDCLVESDDERDVRLGLDILTVAQHPELHARLEQLAIDERVTVRTDALERLRDAAPSLAATAARVGVDDPSPAVRAASVRVLAAAHEPSDVDAVLAHAADPSRDVRLAVAFALTRMSDEAGLASLDADIGRLSASENPDDRALAGLLLGECDPGSPVDRSVLQPLLADADPDVVVAALGAVQWPDDAERLAAVAVHVHDRRTAEAAVDALIRSGDAALEPVDRGLSTPSPDRRSQELLVRVARTVGGPVAAEVLGRHLAHRDADVGLAVMSALASFGPSDDPRYLEVVPRDVEHATHVLRALVAFHDHSSSTELLCAALRDELDLLHRRVIAGLSMRHGTTGLERVAYQLAQRDARSHSLAIEWLDVTLSGPDRSVISLLEPDLFARERLQQLTRTFPLPMLDVADLLVEIARDDDARWRPWIKACALHVASTLAPGHLDGLTVAAESSTPRAGLEAELLHETIADLRARQLDLV